MTLSSINTTMSKTLLVQLTKVNYDNNAYDLEGPHYELTIVVKTIQSIHKNEYYDITYHYEFKSGNLENEESAYEETLLLMQTLHPFCSYQEEETLEPQYKSHICKNDLTTKMVSYLLMDDDTLSTQIGNSTPQDYRRNIMLTLSYFCI